MNNAWSRKTVVALACAGAWLATAARADVEFSSYIRAGAETRFMLTDAATGKKSELLAVGGKFAGVTVTGFDFQTETLTVKDEAGTRALTMPRSAAAPLALAEDERKPETSRPDAAQLGELMDRRKERGKPELTPEEITQRLEKRAAKKPDVPLPRTAKGKKGAPAAATPADGQPAPEADRAALTQQLSQTRARLEKLRAATDRPKAQTKTTQVETEIADLERKLGEVEK